MYHLILLKTDRKAEDKVILAADGDTILSFYVEMININS